MTSRYEFWRRVIGKAPWCVLMLWFDAVLRMRNSLAAKSESALKIKKLILPTKMPKSRVAAIGGCQGRKPLEELSRIRCQPRKGRQDVCAARRQVLMFRKAILSCGTIPNEKRRRLSLSRTPPAAPLGLFLLDSHGFQGLTPLATSCRRYAAEDNCAISTTCDERML
ncbi:MAG TPA: hypothetical protein VHC19_03180, partial [Pirellulales bacterium]|nr:hypothetical protein [Pirellulales bacterium]